MKNSVPFVVAFRQDYPYTEYIRNGMVFTLSWKERKAMRSVIKHGTNLRFKETWKLTSSEFFLQARSSYGMEELAMIKQMVQA